MIRVRSNTMFQYLDLLREEGYYLHLMAETDPVAFIRILWHKPILIILNTLFYFQMKERIKYAAQYLMKLFQIWIQPIPVRTHKITQINLTSANRSNTNMYSSIL